MEQAVAEACMQATVFSPSDGRVNLRVLSAARRSVCFLHFLDAWQTTPKSQYSVTRVHPNPGSQSAACQTHGHDQPHGLMDRISAYPRQKFLTCQRHTFEGCRQTWKKSNLFPPACVASLYTLWRGRPRLRGSAGSFNSKLADWNTQSL